MAIYFLKQSFEKKCHNYSMSYAYMCYAYQEICKVGFGKRHIHKVVHRTVFSTVLEVWPFTLSLEPCTVRNQFGTSTGRGYKFTSVGYRTIWMTPPYLLIVLLSKETEPHCNWVLCQYSCLLRLIINLQQISAKSSALFNRKTQGSLTCCSNELQIGT